MDQLVFQAPRSNGVPENFVLHCGTAQFHSLPGVHLPARLNCIAMHYHATRSHVSFPLLPRPTSCQHQCLTSWESSRRSPEPPTAQSCGPLNIHHLQGRDPEILHLLSHTQHQPLTRNQAFNQPVRCLAKPNTPGQHH